MAFFVVVAAYLNYIEKWKYLKILSKQVITAIILSIYASKQAGGVWGGMGGGGQRGRIGKL